MIRPATTATLLAAALATAGPAADWPQWRGPDRSNVSAEAGLLDEWPAGGPPLAWKAAGLGDGVAPPAVAGGRVFVTGYRGDDEYCAALSEADGKELWAVKVGPAVKEMAVMRHLSQRTPTVGGGRVFVVTALGGYVALAADTGRELWRKDALADFGARRHAFGFCDYPLLDGGRLVVTPGGDRAAVAALDPATGATVWACALPDGGDRHGHTVLVPLEAGGVRQYVNHLSRWMVGVAAADGRLLWRYDGMKTKVATSHAPIVRGDTVFYASGYGAGHALLRVRKVGEAWAAEEVYHRQPDRPYNGWLGSPTQVGDHVYINGSAGLVKLDRAAGETVWTAKTGRVTYTVASGRFYVWGQTGTMTLEEAGDGGLRRVGEFRPFEKLAGQYGATFPVVANGRLYVRDEGTLHAYRVRAAARPRDKVPDAVFVPTPDDVVTRMLDLARVTKDDVVYDLGSGDGRIVIAAAKTRGCRAVGVELDRELVATARAKAKEAGVERLTAIEHGDLFEADFSGATVVALYVLPEMSRKLVPKFDKLKPGVRVISHAFAIPGVTPDRVIRVTSEEDDVERPVYLYTVPLKRAKAGER